MNESLMTRRGFELEEVVGKLKARLKAGRYALGHRLVEIDLMKDLDVSRAVVREALHRMANEGLIVIEPYRGAIVRSITRKDVEEIFEVLEPITIAITSLAAKKIDQGNNRKLAEDLLETTRQIRKKSKVGGNFIGLAQESMRFHSGLRQLCGNDRLQKIAEQIELQLFRLWYQDVSVEEGLEARWVAGHEAMLEAILDGDIAKAESVTRNYAQKSCATVLKLPDSVFE